MTVGQLRRAIKQYKDTDSIILFCNGHKELEIIGVQDDVYGKYAIITSGQEKGLRELLKEDRSIVEELSSIGTLKQFFRH